MTQDASVYERRADDTGLTISSHSQTNPTAERKKPDVYDWWSLEPYDGARGERAMWKAVITQALMDGMSRSRQAEAMHHKHEATCWLTGNSRDFVQVCMLAGLDSDYVRRKAKRALFSPIAWRAAPGKGKRYLERKIYRQKKKPQSDEVSAPCGQVIFGPWVAGGRA